MAPESTFTVEVRDIPAHRRIAVPSTLVREALAGLPIRDALEAPDTAPAGGGDLDVELYADGGHVFASGQITGWLEVACSRCVGPVRLALDEPVRVTYMPRHQLAALGAVADDDDDNAPGKPGKDAARTRDDADGAEMPAQDLDVFPYDGEKIDLEPMVREQYILAVPFAPLCRDDCAGLCAQCGVDRNAQTCACVELHPDFATAGAAPSRFAALRGLKLPR